MADQLTPDGAAPSGFAKFAGPLQGFFAKGGAARGIKVGELLLPLGLIGVLAILLIPMPPVALDLFLALSMTLSVVVLVTVVFVGTALELTSFPTILLIAALLRLGLNVASTRLILTEGHTGTAAAGNVIQAFGGFVAGGNYVIGSIVFVILIIINFVVITKGAGRIAEVSARFTLDAMPGKQMAIDADLSAGLVDEEGAKERRRNLELESTFFGSMDGASKFVRGDAIAGLLITFINIVGGIVIGVLQRDMELAEAAENYTLLTIGDGLVSQVPGLIISVAAGLLISKTGMGGPTDQVLAKQLSANPYSLLIAGVLVFFMAVIPGLPAMPFLVMFAGATGLAAYMFWRKAKNRKLEAEEAAANKRPDRGRADGMASAGGGGAGGGAGGGEGGGPEPDSLAAALEIDQVRLELGYGLLPLINGTSILGTMADQVKGVRTTLANQFGFVMPVVRMVDNLQLPSDNYVIYIKEIEAGRGELRANRLLVISHDNSPITLRGEKTVDPTFGLSAMWVPESMREEAMFKGYHVIDTMAVLTTHLAEIIKGHMHELLSYSYVQDMIEKLPDNVKTMCKDVFPERVPLSFLQRVLQNLLLERVSIRDIGLIVEAMIDGHHSGVKSPVMLTEFVRNALARQISHSHANEKGEIDAIMLNAQWEQILNEALEGDAGSGAAVLTLPPQRLKQFKTILDEEIQRQAQQQRTPVFVVSGRLRPYLLSHLTYMNTPIPLMSIHEVHPRYRLTIRGRLGDRPPAQGAGGPAGAKAR